VSRWEGGKILEADFAQLEFRTAAYLSQDSTAIKEIEDGFDVHSYTAQVITDAGQPTSRQEAKAHTFAPLYGATGFGRSEAEASYYEQFSSKYKGVAKWHKTLASEALQTGRIKIPSGRSFAFPYVVRRGNGSVSHFTQIKNYPVQAFATADIVPLVLMTIDNMLMNMDSCIVNTVHDSIVIDVHPDEVDDVLKIVNSINSEMKKLIDTRWNIDFNVPLKLDAKIGDNWLDTKDV
jgi:DNA polymerase-1